MLHTSPPKYRQNYNKSCTYRLPRIPLPHTIARNARI